MGYVTNIEQESLKNENFRRVLYTAKHSQLVLMSLLPKEEIGEETHGHLDQFLRFEAGVGKVVLNGEERKVRDGDAVVIPGRHQTQCHQFFKRYPAQTLHRLFSAGTQRWNNPRDKSGCLGRRTRPF